MKGLKRKTPNYDQRQEEAYNLLKELQAKKSRNQFTIFGEHVATKIEALKTSYAQNVVEHLISNILFEASIGKYDYPAECMTPLSTHSHSSHSNLSVHTNLSSPQYNNASSPSPQLQNLSQNTPHYTTEKTKNVHEPLIPQYTSLLRPQLQHTSEQMENTQFTISETVQHSQNMSEILSQAILFADIPLSK